MKYCWSCQTNKPRSEFYQNQSRPDGLQNECKQCARARIRDRYWQPDTEAQMWVDYVSSADFGKKLVDGFGLLSDEDPVEEDYLSYLNVIQY